MQALRRLVCVSLCVLLACAVSWGSSGPIVKQRVESELELDLRMIVEDFSPSLMALAGIDDENAPEVIEALMAALGVGALDRMIIRNSVNDERGITSITVTLDPSADGGLLADMFAVSPEPFRFGRYLEEDDVVLALFGAGLVERIHALENLLSRPEVRQIAPMIPPEPLSITTMWGIDAEKDILPLLSGELDLVVFPCPAGRECETPGIALVLGLTDGPAFRDMLLDALSTILGTEKGDALRAVEGRSAGEFTFYPIEDEVAYAIGPDFGLLTTDADRLMAVVAGGGKKGMSGVEASSYARVNGDMLLGWLTELIAATGGNDPEAELIAEVLGSIGEQDVGTIELTARTGGNKMELEIRVPASVYTAYYHFLKELFATLPEMTALEAQAKAGTDLQGIVGRVDEALTRWGQDHEATFPESLEQLVEAGYLDAVPALVPTPLGRYVDGGFTYLPLADETGVATGYYFFVYGQGDGTGYDVFTPENVSDPSVFRVGKDGEGDGVVGFSYDGTAIEHVEAWSSEGE